MAQITSSATQGTNIPKWMSEGHQNLYDRANDLSFEPYPAYDGPRVASFSPDQQSSMDLTRRQVGLGQGELLSGIGATEGAMQRPGEVSEGMDRTRAAANMSQGVSTGMDLTAMSAMGPNAQGIAQYMDPYNQLVTQDVVRELGRQNDIQAQGDAAAAAQSGAFGGARHGLVESERNRNFGRTVSDVVSQRNSQNYQQALGQFNVQQGMQRGAGGQLAGIAANQQGIQMGAAGQLAGMATGQQQAQMAGGQALANMGGQLQGMGAQDAASLMGIGSLQQGLTQAGLDTRYEDYQRQIEWPYQQVGFASDILQGTPTTQQTMTTGTATKPGPSTLSQIGGLVGAGLGLAGGLSGLL